MALLYLHHYMDFIEKHVVTPERKMRISKRNYITLQNHSQDVYVKTAGFLLLKTNATKSKDSFDKMWYHMLVFYSKLTKVKKGVDYAG